MIQRDRAGDFNADAFKKCAGFGIQGLPIPSEFGGSAADPLTVVIAMEALGYGCLDNGLLFSINAQMWSFELPSWNSARRNKNRSTGEIEREVILLTFSADIGLPREGARQM